MSTYVNHPHAGHECMTCGLDALTYDGEDYGFLLFVCDSCGAEHHCHDRCAYLDKPLRRG